MSELFEKFKKVYICSCKIAQVYCSLYFVYICWSSVCWMIQWMTVI